jgi:hypothetical protein
MSKAVSKKVKFDVRIRAFALFVFAVDEGAVQCRERLGGLLKYYEREAA